MGLGRPWREAKRGMSQFGIMPIGKRTGKVKDNGLLGQERNIGETIQQDKPKKPTERRMVGVGLNGIIYQANP